MTPVAKGFLIGCSVLLVLGIVGVAGFVWFAKTKGEAIVKNAEQRQKDGKAFGKNVPESACATEAMTRYKKSPGILAGIEQHLWLAACLDTSAFEPASPSIAFSRRS